MAAEPEVIPAVFTDKDMEQIADLPNPRDGNSFENGAWVQSFGRRPRVVVHGADSEIRAVVFPNGVLDEEGESIDAPASIGPMMFVAEKDSTDNIGLMAAYAAKTALHEAAIELR